jgi:hypothetical protein
MNSRMLEYLDVTEQPSEWLDLLKENIFFMIPFADRDTFQNDLKAANDTTDPISVEHQLLRSDGSLITLNGWLSIARNENSEPHYTLFYTQAKKHGSESQISGNSPYLRALKCAYNVLPVQLHDEDRRMHSRAKDLRDQSAERLSDARRGRQELLAGQLYH